MYSEGIHEICHFPMDFFPPENNKTAKGWTLTVSFIFYRDTFIIMIRSLIQLCHDKFQSIIFQTSTTCPFCWFYYFLHCLANESISKFENVQFSDTNHALVLKKRVTNKDLFEEHYMGLWSCDCCVMQSEPNSYLKKTK